MRIRPTVDDDEPALRGLYLAAFGAGAGRTVGDLAIELL